MPVPLQASHSTATGSQPLVAVTWKGLYKPRPLQCGHGRSFKGGPPEIEIL